MSTEATTNLPKRETPVCKRSPEQRYVHIAKRALERGGITITPEQVATVERKVRFVRAAVNQRKPYAVGILPQKIAEEREGKIHIYRVLNAGKGHLFVWNQPFKCLVSYRGPETTA